MSERVQAAIYCRMSKAEDTVKVDDQERQCREAAERRGWEVAEVYVDNSKSAWKRNRKRPAWDAMLVAVAAGRFGAIVNFWGDRLVRQPRDLEDLLDLREVGNIKVAAIMGEYDMDNKDHRMMMRWEVARACNESDTISMRKKNGIERLRREGLTRPGGPGGRCFGFEQDGVTHRESETRWVRAAAADILAGSSLGICARHLADFGVTTTSGKPMVLSALRRILTYPRMAGLMPDGVSQAAWEPVLDMATWRAVQAVIGLNEKHQNAGKGALYLLSGIAVCGSCGRVLWAGRNAAGPAYKCVPRQMKEKTVGCGRVHRSIALLDVFAGTCVVERVNHPDNPTARPLAPGLADEYASLAAQRVELEDIMRDHRRGSLPALIERLDSLDRRLTELRDLAGDDARSRLIAAHRGLSWEQWLALPLSAQRALVTATFTVRVLPSSRRGPGFRPEDVEMLPR